MKMHAAFLCATLLAAGCGGIKVPKPVTPPELARVRERAPRFSVLAADGSELSSERFAGRVLLVLGAELDFIGELLPWLETFSARYGPAGEPYAALAVLEGIRPQRLVQLPDHLAAALERLEKAPALIGADPLREYAKAMGFVGEGPHLAAIAPDGTLLALVDGTAEPGRIEEVCFALDGVLAPRRAKDTRR